MSSGDGFDGPSYVIASLQQARKRLSNMGSEKMLRDHSEIWEAYCDVEQAIEVSKFVYHLHDRLGEVRPLKSSSKNAPSLLPLDELQSRYKRADSIIVCAETAFTAGRAEEALELARKARDELKVLLLGKAKLDRLTRRKALSN